SPPPHGGGPGPITETASSSPPAFALSLESAGGYTPTPPSSPQSISSRSSSAAASCHGDKRSAPRGPRHTVISAKRAGPASSTSRAAKPGSHHGNNGRLVERRGSRGHLNGGRRVRS